MVHKGLAYGVGSGEQLDWFPAGQPDAALHVFIHGGYWQALSKNESTFAATDFLANGVAFAAIDYTLAPQASIMHMLDQCRRSIAWLHTNAQALGFDRDRIYLSGSSAGAHLAALLLVTDWPSLGMPGDVIKGATLMSGIFDLRPICHTYVNEPLGLDEPTAAELSPLFADLADLAPTIVCWGANETDEFKRQSREFGAAMHRAGNDVQVFEVPARNHFDIVHTLAAADESLGRRVLAAMT